MMQYRHKLESFAFFDRVRIQRHLEKMAQKGWRLTKIGRFFWTYRRAVPQKLHYTVTYYPSASEFDPEPSEKQKIYQELSAGTGWEFVCSAAQRQVFCSEAEDPVAMETDPTVEVHTIHETAKRSYLLIYSFLLLWSLWNIGELISGLMKDPVPILSSSVDLILAMCWMLQLVFSAVTLIGYFRWYRRARQACQWGEFYPTPGYTVIQNVLICTILAVFAYWCIDSFRAGNRLAAVVMLLALGYVIVLNLGLYGMRQLMKRKKASRGRNLFFTSAVCLLLAMGMMAGIAKAAAAGAFTGLIEDPANPRQDLRLQMEDLQQTQTERYAYHARWNETVFLGYYTARQVMEYIDPEDPENPERLPELFYSVTVVKLPGLYDLCKNAYLRNADRSETDWKHHYAPIDGAAWGAVEAYQLTDPAMKRFYSFLLCYDDRIVSIRLDWEPTAEQMRIIAQKLGGVAAGA